MEAKSEDGTRLELASLVTNEESYEVTDDTVLGATSPKGHVGGFYLGTSEAHLLWISSA